MNEVTDMETVITEFPNRRKEFFLEINSFEREEHIDSFLIYFLSPVITGIKPSSTITVSAEQEKRLVRLYEEKLYEMGFDYFKLRSCAKKSLIFVYNKDSLERYLNFRDCREILYKEGYKGLNLSEMLTKIKNRITENDFPHEIGLFLGIPACDVEGFLSCKECIFSGYWKVYDRLEIASEIFGLYDLSRNIVVENTLNGVPLNKTISKIKNMYLSNIDILQ